MTPEIIPASGKQKSFRNKEDGHEKERKNSLKRKIDCTVHGGSDGVFAHAGPLTDGRYIMVTDTGYAPGVLEGTWVTAEQIAADGESGIQPGDSIQENENVVWELTVTSAKDAADLTVTLKDKNGTFIAPKGGNNNGINEGKYDWKVELDQENQKFTFGGQEDDTVVLASNKGSQNKFRAYKTATVNGNPNAYLSEFTLYKADDGGSSSVTVAAPQATPQAGEVEPGTTNR